MLSCFLPFSTLMLILKNPEGRYLTWIGLFHIPLQSRVPIFFLGGGQPVLQKGAATKFAYKLPFKPFNPRLFIYLL